MFARARAVWFACACVRLCWGLCVYVHAHFNPPAPAKPTLFWLTGEPALTVLPASLAEAKATHCRALIGRDRRSSSRSTERGSQERGYWLTPQSTFETPRGSASVIGAWPFLWAVLQFRLARSVKPREKVAIEIELSRTADCVTAAGSCCHQN